MMLKDISSGDGTARQRARAQRFVAILPLLLVVALSFVLALVVYLMTAAPTITTRFGGTDGGELAATVVSGGVPHPSGYPTYMLLARMVYLMEHGEPAARIVLLSVWTGALAIACTVAIIWIVLLRTSQSPSGWLLIAAGFGALTFAFSPRFWSQAVIIEVYAHYMAWLALCTLLFFTWLLTQRPLAALVMSLCLGWGVGAHLTILAFVPAAGAAWFVARERPRLSLRFSLALLLCFLVGLGVYGWLPVWSARTVVPNWGDERTLSGLWTHISGAEYRYLVGIVPWPQRLGRISFTARDLLAQPGPVGLVLAVWWGLPYLWRTARPAAVFTGTIAGIGLIFAVTYGGADGTVYLLPWTWVWGIWAGVGAFAAYVAIPRERNWARFARGAYLVLLVGAVAVMLLRSFEHLDLHDDTSTRDQALSMLRSLPANAILLTDTDSETFGTWYALYTLGARSDVTAIEIRLLDRPWYAVQLRRQLHLGGEQNVCSALQATKRPLLRAIPQRDAVAVQPTFIASIPACRQ